MARGGGVGAAAGEAVGLTSLDGVRADVDVALTVGTNVLVPANRAASGGGRQWPQRRDGHGATQQPHHRPTSHPHASALPPYQINLDTSG